MPGTLELVYQRMLEDIDTKEQAAHISYKDMENLEFQVLLTNNYCATANSIHICFLMKIKRASDKTDGIDTELITVNNFFAHLTKETSVTKYGNDNQLIPIFSPYEI